MIPKILVAGIGNVLLQDDGFGPQAIARLESEYEIGEEVELLDLGTPGLDFVDYLVGREALILLDALATGGEPGEILTFNREQLQQFMPTMRLSAHQPSLQQTLATAEAAGIDLKQVLLVGIVGHSYEVTTELGPYVSRAMPDALELVADVLRGMGVSVKPREVAAPQGAWWAAPALRR